MNSRLSPENEQVNLKETSLTVSPVRDTKREEKEAEEEDDVQKRRKRSRGRG